MRLFLVFVFLIFLLSLGFSPLAYADSNDRLVLAYYYVWYGDGVHGWDNVVYEPSLGSYNSNDTRIIDQHIAWAREAEVDGFLVSWWGINDYTDNVTKSLFDRVKVLYPSFRLAILAEQIVYNETMRWYANHNFSDPYYVEAFKETMLYIVNNYIKPYQDVYLTWNGRPVIVLYAFIDPDHKEDEAYYNSFFNDMKVYIYQQTNVTVSFWSLNTVDAECFDVTAMYLPQLQAKDNPQCPHQNQNYETIKGVKVSVIFPRFEKQGYEPIIGRGNGKTYENCWINALKFNSNIILIVSWNEWYESTSIEPAKQWNKTYLKITKQYIDQLSNFNPYIFKDAIIKLGISIIVVGLIVTVFRKLT